MKETLEGISMEIPMNCSRAKCSECPIRNLAGQSVGCIDLLAKEVQRLRDERAKIVGVWDEAPQDSDYVRLLYKKANVEVYYHPVHYARTLPKTIEQEIAEKYASKLSIITETRENLRDAILQAFEELKEKKK